MTKYKLLALDMDGTMLNDQSEVSSENAEWIQKALDVGVTVSFSTGRGIQSALPYAEMMKLDTPMITVNGSEVWKRPGELYQRIELDPDQVEHLYHLAKQYEEAWFWAYTTERIYNKDEWIHQSRPYNQHQWLKFGYYTEDHNMKEKILEEVSSWNLFEITNSSLSNIEINQKGVSKASGLRSLCQYMNIDMTEVIAVGDSLNDIAAIREVGLGIAMENAQEAVKQAAKAITLSNNDHGVAEVIKKYIFN